ncbi:hypothetical protein [Mycoplasma seminis]|uniref:Lipoprotein n=1 Tax=Mycoplasma seminis TaxID=512749 RepID=A0ABY9H9P2_9MOLU|nr:hypothetical protein [Mycoplasma seminis]WLP85295.1 hypothetical protein Q8852_03150 [Mycoplasma seminis]
MKKLSKLLLLPLGLGASLLPIVAVSCNSEDTKEKKESDQKPTTNNNTNNSNTTNEIAPDEVSKTPEAPATLAEVNKNVVVKQWKHINEDSSHVKKYKTLTKDDLTKFTAGFITSLYQPELELTNNSASTYDANVISQEANNESGEILVKVELTNKQDNTKQEVTLTYQAGKISETERLLDAIGEKVTADDFKWLNLQILGMF